MPEPEKSKESGTPEPAEVRTIRRLVRLMHRYDLTAINLDSGDTRIRLRRRGVESGHSAPPSLPAAAPPPTLGHHTVASHPAGPPSPSANPTAAAVAAPAGSVIESPMVGTYFSSSSPDTPPFVGPGSVVRAETIVCIIEAMKVFTDIPAQMAGTITEVLVKNGQAVEFGQPLYRVNPS